VGRAPLPETLHALFAPSREPHPPPLPKERGGESRKPAKLLSHPIGGRKAGLATICGVDPEKPDAFCLSKAAEPTANRAATLPVPATRERRNQSSRHPGRSYKPSGRMNRKRPTREP
jgi:hypothetical protein